MRKLLKVPTSHLITCLALALIFATATQYNADSHAFLPNPLWVLEVISLTPLFLLLFGLFDWMAAPAQSKTRTPRLAGRYFDWAVSPAQAIAHITILLLICWLPYFVLMWPGNLSNDTTGQLCMFYSLLGHGSYGMSAQHPVFDTLVFGAITYPFYALGHYKVGVSVCISLQAIATASSFATALTWARRRWRAPLRPLTLGLWFLAVCPVVPLMALSLSKDTFFSWVYLLWLVLFLDSLRDGATAGPRRIIASVALGALMCLTKKYGVFVVAGSYACLLVKHLVGVRGGGEDYRRLGVTSLVLLCTLLLGVGGNHTLDVASHATPGLQQDKLLIPIQQTAMCYSRHPEEYSDADKTALSGLMNLQAIDDGTWNPQNTDTIKLWSYTGDSLASEKPKAFVNVWLTHLPKHLKDYWDGWATLVAPLFSFGDIIPLFDNHWHTASSASIVPESAYLKGSFATAGSNTIKAWYTWLGGLPILGIALLQTLYAVLLPAWFLSSAAHSHGRISLIAAVPVIMSFLALLVSPLTIPHFETMRYLIPFVYTTPILLCYSATKSAHASMASRMKGVAL